MASQQHEGGSEGKSNGSQGAGVFSQELFEAVRAGNVDEVRRIGSQQGVDVNAKVSERETRSEINNMMYVCFE